ncbi:EamA family transporter [Streptomyces actuosus]|uniref:EamA family transporter n=1 Tax=Streptomyces actuosus TaxID=1885 RepID=A0ABS2VZY9_STRAS|nr:EamA family transporter [Streptomyces actuosus]
MFVGIAPVIWGSHYLVTTEFLPPDRPLLAAALRALPAGLTITLAYRQVPRGAWWWRVPVLGMLNFGLFFGLMFVAAYRIPGGTAATIGTINLVFTIGLGWLVLRERARWFQILGGLGGLGGVGLLVANASTPLDPIGLAAAVGGAATFAAGLVMTKRWGRPAPVLLFTAWQLMAAGLVLLPLSLLLEGPVPHLTAGNITGYAYIGVLGTALAYSLMFKGLDLVPAAAASFLSLLNPLTASLLGLVVLGQTLTPLQLLGAALVVASIASGLMPGPAVPPTTRR